MEFIKPNRMFLPDKQMIDEIGRAAALLVGHVAVQIGSLSPLSARTTLRAVHLIATI